MKKVSLSHQKALAVLKKDGKNYEEVKNRATVLLSNGCEMLRKEDGWVIMGYAWDDSDLNEWGL